MKSARSTEENEDQETTSNPCYSSQAIQVHGTTGSVQEVILSCCLPSGAETEQHDGKCRHRVLFVCSRRTRGKWS